MLLRLLIPTLLALPVLARPAAAQSCWPVGVLLAVRDSAGGPVAPAALDSVGLFAPYEGIRRAVVRAPYEAPASPEDPANSLQFSRSGCRIQIDSVSLAMGGRTMMLVLEMRIDSEERGTASLFFFEAPPFRPGRYRLRWDPTEEGGYREPPLIPAEGRWTRLE